MRLLAAFLLIPMLLCGQKKVSFFDEFDGSELNLAKWIPHGMKTLVGAAGLPVVGGGQIHLRPGQTLTTFGLFSQRYGKFEIRLRWPMGKGVRARFRLMPIPLAPLPAIDVFTAEGAKISFGNYWGTEQTEHSFGDSFDGPAAGLHTVAIEWDRASITWSVDGKERFRSTDGVPQQPMFLLLEAEGDGAGSETVDVDYIHVYP
jgi:hypothetical protein